MLQDFLNLNIFAFFLLFTRIGTAMSTLPGFSALYVPINIRLLLGLAVTFVVMPILVDRLPPLPATTSALAILFVGEALIGAFLGLIGRILIGALQTAGTLIAYFSSIANAFVLDPVAEEQSSVFAGFLGTLGLLLVFVTDAHHLMLAAVFDSYTLFIPGNPLPIGDFTEMLAKLVDKSFALGLQLSAPLILTAITYYVGLGLLGRLMPALPVFFFGVPIQLLTQIAVVMVVLSGAMMVFLGRFREGFLAFTSS